MLVNLATRTGLLGRDIILKLLGEKRSTKLRRNIIYQFFDKFLQLFYWGVQFNRPKILQNTGSNQQPIKLIIQVMSLLVFFAVIAIALPKLYALAVTKIPLYVLLIIAVAAILVFLILERWQGKLNQN